MPGIASAAIASGCEGWVTIRGPVSSASSPATLLMTGSIGHAVYWDPTATGALGGLTASSSAYVGALHQVGFLLSTSVTGTLVADIFLTGNQQLTAI